MARGETLNNLLVNLFSGYKACTNHAFVQYFSAKEDKYNQGKNFTVDQLIDLVLNKYRTLQEIEQWNQPTEDHKQLMALKAQIEGDGRKRPSNLKGSKKKTLKRQKKGKIRVKGNLTLEENAHTSSGSKSHQNRVSGSLRG